MNTCVICGKEYEPYRCYGKRQLTCSPECRKKYARIYAQNHPKRYEYAASAKARAKKRRNGHVICRICGQPVFRTFAVGEGTPQMHEECVLEDCRATLMSGGKLNRAQQSRLYSRGWTIGDMKRYVEEIKNGEITFYDQS